MYSTTARIFIALSPEIVTVIQEHSRQKTSKPSAVLPITILTNNQVEQALAHPHNKPLKEMIAIDQADIVRTDRVLIKAQESLEDQRLFIEESLSELQAKKREVPNKTELENAVNTLNEQYKLLSNVQNALNHGTKVVADARKAEAELCLKQNDEWKDYRTKQLEDLRNAVVDAARKTGHPLPQGEIDNLLRQDLQDVLDRFVDLGASKDLPPAELEKILSLKNPDFDTYFKMKAYLALRSVIPQKENIGGIMRDLNPLFEQAKRDGEQLSNKQIEEIKAFDNKVKPTLETTNNNYNTLIQLEATRDELLQKVGVLVEPIREKVEQRVAEVKPRAQTPHM